MVKKGLVRITTIPISLEKLLEGQLTYMKDHFDVVAISSEKEQLQAYGDKEGVRVFSLELTRKITPAKDMLAVYNLYKFLKKEKPCIVHSHTPKAGIVGMMAAWLAGVPNRLHTVAGLPLMETTGFKRKILNLVEKLTYFFATRIYPNSKGLYEFILSEKFTKSAKLSIIAQGSSNGIDTSFFNPAEYSDQQRNTLRTKFGIPKENFVFIFVGRLVKDKGINELVAAFVKLISEKEHISLLLVGPLEQDLDPLSPETLQIINENAFINHVGYQQDVRSYFAVSDALAFPSYREGFPNVVMQAGAMGLPAIVTNINGCNEIIEHGSNGLLVPVKNSEALYNSMKQFATQPLLYSSLKSSVRQRIVDRYNRNEVWQALLEEYKSMEDC